MARVRGYRYVGNAKKAFPEYVGQFQTVEMLRPSLRQQSPHSPAQSLLSAPGGNHCPEFAGHEKQLPSGSPNLPIQACALKHPQRLPASGVRLAFYCERPQACRLLHHDRARLYLVCHRTSLSAGSNRRPTQAPPALWRMTITPQPRQADGKWNELPSPPAPWVGRRAPSPDFSALVGMCSSHSHRRAPGCPID